MQYFRNLPIKRKMTVAVLVTTTIALLLACGTFVAYERLTSRRAMARNLTVLADALARNSGAALSFSEIQDTKESAAKILAALGAEPAVVAACLYTENGSLHATYARTATEAKFPTTPEQEGTRIEGDFMLVVRPVNDEGKRIGTIYLRANLAELNARLQLYAGISGLVLLGSFLLALALSSALQRLILRPILALTDTAKRIAETRDYTARAQKLSGDELGVLTDAFNQMLGDIQARTGDLEAANKSLQAQAGQITEGVRVLGVSGANILTATTQLSSTAMETAAAVSQTTTTVEEVRQNAEVSSRRAMLVSEGAQKAAGISQRGKQAAENVANGINRIQEQMFSIAESMVRLSEQSQAIGEIVASVEDLAAQSNLLAVNAAIEAAKAGEHGKGFAIVAQEVKNLADQSREATSQVRGILRDIQKATSAAAMATEQGSKAVEAGVRQTGEAGEAILTLAESVGQAAQSATQIAASSAQQVAGMNQVASAMESIKQASIQNVQSAENLEGAARELNQLGDRLKRTVEQIKK
jgi:methyl-accepting chemotaxis protein